MTPSSEDDGRRSIWGSADGYASEAIWESKESFKQKLMATTGAPDFSNPEFENTLDKRSDQVAPGDFVLLFRDKDIASHVSLVTKVSETLVSGYQGNFRPGGYDEYNRATKYELRSSIRRAYTDPMGERYLGSKVLPWQIDLQKMWYHSERPDGKPSVGAPLKDYISTENPVLFQFNFYKWNE